MNIEDNKHSPLKAVVIISFIVLLYDVISGLIQGRIVGEISNLAACSWWNFVVSLISDAILIIICFLGTKKMYDKSLIDLSDIRKKFLKYFVIGLLIAFPSFIITNYILEISASILPGLSVVDDMFKELRNNVKTTTDIVLTFLSIGIITPMAEEIFFRGFCYKLLRMKYNKFVSLSILTMLFILFHPVPNWIPHLILLNLILCLSYEYSNSLVVPISMHATLNVLSLIKLFY
jgi:membrane protease YdiL (CAAX protease family)